MDGGGRDKFKTGIANKAFKDNEILLNIEKRDLRKLYEKERNETKAYGNVS